MNTKKYRILSKLGTVWGVMITLILLAIISFFINGNLIGTGRLMEITDGAGILDMEFSYTAEEAYTILGALGQEGRAFCLTRITPLDMIYPAAYTLFFMALLAFLIGKIKPKNERWMLLAFLPIVGGLFDYLENIMIIIMLNNYPVQHIGIAQTANIFTIIKWSAFPVTITIIIIALIILFVRRIKQ